jgi:Protein of unknown function (DUF2384)
MNINQPQEDAEFRKRVSGAARRAFLNIAEVWSLNDREQVDLLALDDLAALEQFRQPSDETLPGDVLYRISYVLGIYRALHILLPRDAADATVRRPNKNVLFGGKSALDLMITRNLADLAKVRAYLDGQIDPPWS